MSFPNIFIIQFNALNARYVKENVANHGFLEVLRGSVFDPCSKFSVERAKSGDHGLVHIRCIYNNKYLVRQSNTSTWIVASAEEPEEDQSKWSSTLFRPTRVDNAFQFMHVQGQTQRYLTVSHHGSSGTSCLSLSNTTSQPHRFILFDWETVFIMPKYVSFKADDGRYLSTRLINGQQYLQFASNDKADQSCWFEAEASNDGRIYLKSLQLGRYWRRDFAGSWILADAASQSSADLYWAIKVEDNIIALRDNLSGRFCERANTTDVTRDCLRMAVATISQRTRLVVEEAVLSRRIDNVIYRLMDSRIYNERALIVASNEAVNKTQDEHDMELNFSYTESISSTWNAAVSGSFGIEASFRAGIPFLVQKQITISVEKSGGYEWGKTIEQSTEVSTTYNVIVPPNTMVIVRLLATEASFDVPFSYVQRDTLFDGREVISEIDGGIFEGVNSYNFRYEIEEQKLEPTDLMQQEKVSKTVGVKAELRRSSL